MFIIVLICLIVGLVGFYLSLKKQKPTFLFLSFTLCLFSSFLFSFYVDGRNSDKINNFKNMSYQKFADLDSFATQNDPKNTGINEHIASLQGQIDELRAKSIATEQKEIIRFNAQEKDPCKQLPTPAYTEGQYDYPIDPKYGDIGYLGQLFTALPCGSERIEHIPGIFEKKYTLGASITLVNPPSTQLLSTFQSLGFTCQTENIKVEMCTYWKLDKTTPVEDIIKLEPFYKEFETLSCVNCA